MPHSFYLFHCFFLRTDGTPSGDLQGLFDEPYTELSKDVDLGSDCLVALMQAGLIATPSPSGGGEFDFIATKVCAASSFPSPSI